MIKYAREGGTAMPSCSTCATDIPRPTTPAAGRPRKYHEGACTGTARLAAQRHRRGVVAPRLDRCRMCGDPVPGRRLYFDGQDCADRYARLARADRAWLLRHGPDGEGAAESAAEITPGMSPPARQWRLARRRRLAAGERRTG